MTWLEWGSLRIGASDLTSTGRSESSLTDGSSRARVIVTTASSSLRQRPPINMRGPDTPSVVGDAPSGHRTNGRLFGHAIAVLTSLASANQSIAGRPHIKGRAAAEIGRDLGADDRRQGLAVENRIGHELTQHGRKFEAVPGACAEDRN